MRGEIAHERNERNAYVQKIEARIVALETRPPPHAQPLESDRTWCVVGGYGRLVKAACIECASAARDAVDSFVEIDDTHVSAVRSVLLARFESP